MDLLLALVVLGVAAAPLALLAGWFDRRASRRLGPLVNRPDNDAWWRSTMPWPHGVQEDADLAWTARDPNRRGGPLRRPEASDGPDEVRIDPIHLRPVMRRR